MVTKGAFRQGGMGINRSHNTEISLSRDRQATGQICHGDPVAAADRQREFRHPLPVTA